MKEHTKSLLTLTVLCFSLFIFISNSYGEFGQETPIFKFEAGDTLEEIRAKIKHNGYSFKVDRNWVFDMSPEKKERFFGRRAPLFPKMADVHDGIGPLAMYLQKQCPSSFDWRNYNGHSYIGPIRDQGDCGSCYAFGACAAAEGTYNYANGLYDGNCADFSEAYLAFCLSNYYSGFDGCEGADYDYEELTALTVYGVCNEDVYPYQDHEQLCGVSWTPQTVTFDSWHRVPCGDTDAIKIAIMTYGVVDAAVMATSAFSAYKSGIYEDANISCGSNPCYYTPTNHAIALVGWDDNPPEGGGGCWILRNSWGTSWGENGYMRIRYGSARVNCEVCYLVKQTAVSPAPTPTPENAKMSVISPDDGFRANKGENTVVSVSLTDSNTAITDATVLVTSSYKKDFLLKTDAFGGEAGSNRTSSRAVFYLLDNGVSPDEIANDGIYSRNWRPTNTGTVTLEINASGLGDTTLTESITGEVIDPSWER
ncbi:MAG: hypothetical protein HQ551_08605 [Desulfobacteraceae bacterium]|nr:hypothetical protein [Desulfobacteraceae bacterium]